jgi:hypothetical protein
MFIQHPKDLLERITGRGTQKNFWRESHVTPSKFFGHKGICGTEKIYGRREHRQETRYGDSWGWGREVNMPKGPKNAKKERSRKRAARSSTAHLDKLIEEATVDCYNESEEVTGIFTMLEENLAVPFATTLLGVEVTVGRVDLNDAGEIVAVCRRGRERPRVPVIDLPLPEPAPKGAEWIDAYRRWARWK